jgi:lipoteichoic acid synthase
MIKRSLSVVKSPFILFTILLLLKIYIAQLIIFDDGALWLPLLNGLPTVWVVFGLIEWLMVKRKILGYLIADAVMTSIYFAAIMYHQYFGVIVTYHALQQANQVTQVKGSVFQLLHPYFLLLFIDVVIIGLLLFRKGTRIWGKPYSERIRTGAATVMIILLLICFSSVWKERNGMSEIKQAKEMGILNYEVYTFFPERKESISNAAGFTQNEIEQFKGSTNAATPTLWRSAEGKNVIIIQLEAFQNFLLGLKLDNTEVTPNLNALMQDSLYFPNFFQMVGQGNTSDAEFVVNTSLYIPPHGAATVEYTDKALPSMPKLFKQKGYLTSTFHTNDVTFWNRNELYKALGFDRYYDKSFFGDADPVALASSDEVLYEKTAAEMEKINKKGQPFYAQIISLSSHYPFNIPASKDHILLPDRFQGSFVGDYIQAENYTDYALGLFFDKLKASHLWENSLFIIYGDHMGLPIYSLSDNDKSLLHEVFGKDYSFPQMMNVPLLIVAPGTTKPAVLSRVGGQVDLMPTIANLVGISLQDTLHFGQDLLNAAPNILPQHYYLPKGSFINDAEIFVPGNGFEDGTQYPLNKSGTNELNASKDEYERAQKLFTMSDSYVRQLPQHE